MDQHPFVQIAKTGFIESAICGGTFSLMVEGKSNDFYKLFDWLKALNEV